MYKYLFSVQVDSSLEKGGEISLDSFLEISPDEQRRLKLAEDMYRNEIWKTDLKDAMKTFDVEHLLVINALLTSAHVNQRSIHMVETEFPITREDLAMWVKSSNIDKISKQKLLDSRIGKNK